MHPAIEAMISESQRRYPATRLLGSYHVVGEHTSRQGALDILNKCRLNGRADGAKTVLQVLVLVFHSRA